MLTEFGEFTSACGMTQYWGGAFPPQFNGVSFVNEPVHNLVHRDVLRDSGSTFVASRARDGVEFLASTDPWFRPVNLTVGPDGALYLLDYYREVIEHPEWTSTSVQTLTKSLQRIRSRKDLSHCSRRLSVAAGQESASQPSLG